MTFQKFLSVNQWARETVETLNNSQRINAAKRWKKLNPRKPRK